MSATCLAFSAAVSVLGVATRPCVTARSLVATSHCTCSGGTVAGAVQRVTGSDGLALEFAESAVDLIFARRGDGLSSVMAAPAGFQCRSVEDRRRSYDEALECRSPCRR